MWGLFFAIVVGIPVVIIVVIVAIIQEVVRDKEIEEDRIYPKSEQERLRKEEIRNRRGCANVLILFVGIPLILGIIAYNVLGGASTAPFSSIIATVFAIGSALIIMIVLSITHGGKD